MIAVIDYGVGNLFSLCSSLRYIGQEAVITGDPGVIKDSARIILPGVGAFGDAANKLRDSGLDSVIIEEARSGKPLLGICVGMQLLFEKSFEYGEHIGLGLLKGSVMPIAPLLPENFKIPHIGWNALKFPGLKNELFKYINEGDHVYFVHSFHASDCTDSLAATVEYGAELTAAAASGNVYGTQFHPEKSGDIGLNILRAFAEINRKHT